MMDMVQTAAVATANVVLPGSGAIINSAFELGKVCYEIGLVLNGMQKSAPSIKTQHANTEEDVSYFSWVLEVLEQRVQNQELFTRELQKLISKFETEVKEYDRVMKKILNKSALKQLVFHSDLDTVSTRTRKIAKDLCERINTESSISASAAYAKQEKRAERYMKIVDSPEVVNAMSDPDNQKEILAIITRMGRRNEAMMQSPIDTNDIVLNVMKEKLWASSSRAIRADISNLPDCHFNNICRLYGACYFTATPFIVMEYCELGSLDTFLRQNEANRCKFSLGILAQAAQGINKMHSKGIVHGDLKCDNILVTSSTGPLAKLCDFDRSFDWSALKDKRLVKGSAADAGIEITDAVRYLAPECVEGMLPNSKSDVYSFGMTLYHALAGASPYFDITSDEELRASKLARELPCRDMQRISDCAWELIRQCCGPVPNQRPTMEKVSSALKSLAAEQSTDSHANIAVPLGLSNAILVDEAMDVQTLKGNVERGFVPFDQSTTNLSPKYAGGTLVKSRRIPRSYKFVFLAIVVAGVVVGFVAILKQSSSANNGSSAGSGSSTSPSTGIGSSTDLGFETSSSASTDSSSGAGSEAPFSANSGSSISTGSDFFVE
uniref:Protein kinase domain-containing protein n=1 Tax=Phytophthora fragariae TaxID=53985 RepID=A0A6A3FQM2_9STRA|nr:hypothetical protein PF009_g4088 [Phytophthora fragariae]